MSFVDVWLLHSMLMQLRADVASMERRIGRLEQQQEELRRVIARRDEELDRLRAQQRLTSESVINLMIHTNYPIPVKARPPTRD